MGANWHALITCASPFLREVCAMSEFISNGDCASDSFTKGTGWSHDADNDEYDCDGSQEANSDLTQNVLPKAGMYVVVFTVKNYEAGNICGLADTTEGTDVSADATYTQYIYADSSGVAGVRADASFVGSVDDISVQDIGGDGFGRMRTGNRMV